MNEHETTMDFEDEGVLELEVVGLRRESDSVMSVELADPLRRQLPDWMPGAHIDLGLPDQIRQYSLIGDGSEGNCFSYRIAVLEEPESRGGSRYVHTQLRPGDLVEIGGPRNNFPLIEADHHLLIAGGVGVTPLLPMIRQLEAEQRDWTLFYGGRSRSSMAFLGELSGYGEKVSVQPADEQGPIDLDAAFDQWSPGTTIYCCGPEGLIGAVEERAADLGEGILHTERFSAKPRDDMDDFHPFELVLARTGTRLTVPADRSALEALEALGVNVPSACQDGICGSCETRTLSGMPLHRDSLTDPECTDVFYPCVSRARTPELVLDL